MKTRIEVFQQTYVNRHDIAILLNVSRATANRTYSIADMIDTDELKYRTEPNKVRRSTVQKIHGVSDSELLRQIKSGQGNDRIEIGEPLQFHQIITRGDKK